MKAQFDYKSKKTLIIVAIALVLLIAAIIGTVAFIKGNNDSAAAMTEGDAQVTTDGENNGGDNNANPADNASEGTNNGEIPVIDDNGNTGDNQPANNAGNNSTTNGGTTSNGTTTGSTNNGTTTGTTNPNVPSEEYIQETIIQGEDKKVEETTKIGWEPVGVSALTATTKLGINKATLENQKFAYIEGDSLEDAPVKTGAQKGQKITYVIEIKNTSKMDANNIRIYDTIPEGTTLVENSISDQGINENGRIYWRTNIPAEAPVKLSFTVEITAQNGNILNFAMVDGNPTNETSTEVKHYYTVEHYKENLDGTYELVKTEKVEDVSEGDDTHYTLEEYKGFTPGEVENDGAKVPDNDDLVIKVKYDRNKYPYTINFVELGNETNILATEKGEAKYEDSVPVVEKTDITGFTFESKDKDNIVIDTENNTATVYYTRNSYKVTYKYEGKVPTGASTLPAEATYKYEENVTVAEKATAPGYKFSGWDKQNFTMPAENVVIKGSFTANKDTKYTVEHYIEKLDGTGFELKETTPKAGTTDTEVTATPNSYEGFEFDATVEGTKQSGIVTGDGKLVLKLYYTRNSYDYVINHVEKGNVTNVLAEAEKGSAKYGDTIAVNYKTNIEGFSYDSETTKEIEIKTTGNTATVYYTRNSYDYVINHVEKGNVTNVLAEAEKGSAKYGDTIDVNYKTNIEGFSYDSETTKKIEIKTTGNEATVYYTRNIHNVIYKITGTIDANENFATQEYKYGETITAVAEPTHKGYTFSGWSTIPTTMPDHDVIVTGNFRANTNTAYTVKHHLQKLNADASDKVNGYEVPADGTENKTGTTGTLTTATSKIYTGFTAQSFDQKTIAGNGTTVVDIYYTRNSYDYVINHVEKGNPTNALAEAETGSAQYGASIPVTEKTNITGFTYESKDKANIVINTESNTATVYYTRNSYKVTYEYEGTIPTGASTLPAEATYQYEANVIVAANATAPGYTFSGWDRQNFTMPAENVVIKGSFTANTNTAYTVIHHLQKLNADASDKVNGYEVPADGTENKTGTTGTLTTATSKIYTGFTAQSFDQKTIAGDGTTVVDIYYTRDICNYTVKYYYEIYDETNKEYSYELDNNKTAIKQAQFGDTITSYDDKCITGYEFEKDEGKPLSIVKDETQNVINVYYKKQGFTYQVEYYTEDLNANTYTKVDSLTEKNLTGKFGDTATYTVKDITGFTYKAEKTTPQNATIPANNNLIIKLYYDRNSYNYTIEYYYDGEKDADATEPLSAEYGAQVSTYPDKSNGYTFESDTGAITIGTVVANNVIKVYYAKPTFSIVKTGATTAKVGETVTYTIRVTETSNKVGGTIKVTDALPEGLTFVEASDNGKQNADGDVEWSITLGKGEYKSVTVKATVNNNKIGMDITNIAILDDAENEEDKTKSEKTTSVDELQAVAHELTPGQTGKDAANIILVMDLSSSMNEKIKEFVECTHKHKTWWGEEYCPEGCTEQSDGTWGQWKETSTTRLAAAKKSAQDFINSLYTDSSSKATVTVVTFNKEEVSKNNKYVGPRVLKFGTAENQTTATSSNYTQLVEAIGNIDIGTATSGYGTYIKEALDTTYDTIYGTNGVASKYPNNSNYVIFLGDGEPSDKNDSYKTKINKSADKIKNAGATIYSIGFGEDVADSESTGYKVLYGISSTPKKVYTASDSVALTNIFKNLAGGMTDKPNETTDGKIVVTPARTLYFNTENGKKEYIIVQYKGTTILECKSQTELDNSAYLSYADGKLTFDINAWNSVKGNTQITTGGEDLVLNYYIVRAD